MVINFIHSILKIVIAALDQLSTQTINYQQQILTLGPCRQNLFVTYFNQKGHDDAFCFLLSDNLLVLYLLLESVPYN